MEIFYNTNELSLSRKRQILFDAKDLSTKWWVDKLDSGDISSAQKISMDFGEIVHKLNQGSKFTIVHRVYEYVGVESGEISFSTSNDIPSYYLWIVLSIENLNKIVKNFDLK